jgi:hypothetical protein
MQFRPVHFGRQDFEIDLWMKATIKTHDEKKCCSCKLLRALACVVLHNITRLHFKTKQKIRRTN